MGTCWGADSRPDPTGTYTFHFAGLCKPRWSKSSFRHELDTIITVNSSLKSYDTIHSLKRLICKTYKISSSQDVLILYSHHIISDDDKQTLKQLNVTPNSLLLLAVIAARNEDDEEQEDILKENLGQHLLDDPILQLDVDFDPDVLARRRHQRRRSLDLEDALRGSTQLRRVNAFLSLAGHGNDNDDGTESESMRTSDSDDLDEDGKEEEKAEQIDLRAELRRLRAELHAELGMSDSEPSTSSVALAIEEEKAQQPRADTPRYGYMDEEEEEKAQAQPQRPFAADLARTADAELSELEDTLPLSLPQTVVVHDDDDNYFLQACHMHDDDVVVENEAMREFQLIEDFFALISSDEEEEKNGHDASLMPARIYSDAEYEKLRLRALKGYDIITLEHNVLCYRMQCGHLMNKESLFEYLVSVFKDGSNVHITCPHANKSLSDNVWPCPRCTYHNGLRRTRCEMCDTDKPETKPLCGYSWQYKHMKRILAPNNGDKVDLQHKQDQIARLTNLELLSARNKLQNDCNAQRCYKCDTLYVRRGKLGQVKTKADLEKRYKTKCVFCYATHFCFGCGAQFDDGHICDDSFRSELCTILGQAELKNVGSVEQVPSVRCCPHCCQLIYHTDACKHMDCKSCKTSFCFVCLKEKKNGSWQCGSHSDPCPVAPPQNIKTLPDAILIHKQRFKLF
eukprot:CAMPEP_0202692492 /NCGR_PEP_ID=MMETSP1385-20130828/6847_1 /ASSEMBLY_ACC=CAM_ASM_000861 /TAXON_ID=933848 /ORGANISM="Elphidium margaritaceum" /LENGTH=681 /DNA_ID=CAMNT_0049348029 /DNA_START=40 /DNA_END=2085 /DNA_ORIENTATION=+